MEDDNKEIKEEENKNKSNNNNTKMNSCVYPNKSLVILLCIIGILIVGGGALAVGKIASGRFHKSSDLKINSGFTRNGGHEGRERGMMRGRGNQIVVGYGISGSITAINGNSLTIKDNNGKEYPVVVQDNTSIRNTDGIAKLTDLKVGNNVSVRGPSNSKGEVLANIIIIN